jgi:hypothetical protein
LYRTAKQNGNRLTEWVYHDLLWPIRIEGPPKTITRTPLPRILPFFGENPRNGTADPAVLPVNRGNLRSEFAQHDLLGFLLLSRKKPGILAL